MKHIKPDPNDPRFKRLTGNQCFCTACGEYFTTVGNFDRHQPVTGTCWNPAERGMVQDAMGYWQMPGPDRAIYPSGNAPDEPLAFTRPATSLRQEVLL